MTTTLTKTFTVLVPKPGTRAAAFIDAGSGIVTDDTDPPLTSDDPVDVEAGLGSAILVYFEGNRYKADNIKTFADKVLHAAGRLDLRYPTVARGFFSREDFEAVGTFHFTADWSERALLIARHDVLAQWVDG